MYAINRQHKTKSLVAVSSTQPLNADRFSVLKFHLPGHLPFQSLGKCDLPGLSKGQSGPCERMREVLRIAYLTASGRLDAAAKAH